MNAFFLRGKNWFAIASALFFALTIFDANATLFVRNFDLLGIRVEPQEVYTRASPKPFNPNSQATLYIVTVDDVNSDAKNTAPTLLKAYYDNFPVKIPTEIVTASTWSGMNSPKPAIVIAPEHQLPRSVVSGEWQRASTTLGKMGVPEGYRMLVNHQLVVIAGTTDSNTSHRGACYGAMTLLDLFEKGPFVAAMGDT